MRNRLQRKESRTNSSRAPFFNRGGGSFFSNNYIQTKLTIGQPGDRYEQEADRMADHVMSKSASSTPNVQAKCPACEEKDKSVLPKLQRAEIEEESEEADMGHPKIQRKGNSDFSEGFVDDEDQMAQSPIQLRAAAGSEHTASEGLSQQLQSSKGGGSPLPDNTRSEMESSFGTDFSGVRVHTGSSAVQMNQELGAQAFTNGSDVYFNSGKYSPDSSSGKHLLAHELTHVVQQGGGK